MCADENKELVRRMFEEVWNGKQRDGLDELYSEDLVAHGFGAEDGDLDSYKEYFDLVTTYKEYFDLVTNAFPDVEFEVGELFSDGTMVAATWRASGTHEGALMGVAPAGNSSTVSGIGVDRIEDGKIVESWMTFDCLKMMQNVDAVPEMVAAYN